MGENIRMLRGKLVEKGMSMDDLAKLIGRDRATIYRRFASGGGAFTLQEIRSIASVLELTWDDIYHIFFEQMSQKCE